MQEFKYGNATTGDLWAAWELASRQPIAEMMGLWTRQMGFPLLELTAATPTPGGGLTLQLKQGWFLADGSSVAADEEKTWAIPLFVACSGGAEGGEGTPHIGIMKDATHEVHTSGDGGWVKLNAQQYVPMRVKYPDSMFSGLAAAVRAKSISAADRIGLLSDQYQLCKAGKLDPTRLLELLAAFDQEPNAAPTPNSNPQP